MRICASSPTKTLFLILAIKREQVWDHQRICEHDLGHRSNVNDDLYLSPYPEKKVGVAQAGFEPVHAFGSAWETLSLRDRNRRERKREEHILTMYDSSVTRFIREWQLRESLFTEAESCHFTFTFVFIFMSTFWGAFTFTFMFSSHVHYFKFTFT